MGNQKSKLDASVDADDLKFKRNVWVAVEQVKKGDIAGQCGCFWSKEQVDKFCELQKKSKKPRIYKSQRLYNDDGTVNYA